MSELTQRILSGLILAIIVLFITWWHPVSFDLLCILGGVILGKEWWGLTKARSIWFLPAGTLYIGLAILSLMLIRAQGVPTTFFFFALVWSGDIGAYVVGKLFGKHKIAPTISPGKSWEGLAGSIVATSIVAELYMPIPLAILTGIAFAVIGLAGDMFESSLKRRAGVKDSGRLIPGHGGLFDRVDALLPCAIGTGIFLCFAAKAGL